MSRRNHPDSKRARRAAREEIISARLRRERETQEKVMAFVSEKIAEAKAKARERLNAMSLEEVKAEAERFRSNGGELPPKSKLRSKAAIIAALVPDGNPLDVTA